MTKHTDEDIAVIGIGLRFPGDATNPDTFYDMLLKGRSALVETPAERFNVDAFYHPDQERLGAVNVRHAHYLKDDITTFDAPFFSIQPNEAVYMDPQQRGLLEAVYHALENAGIPMAEAAGTATSVHIGCFTREYDAVLGRDSDMDLKYIATGTGTALLANRLSWFYDFRGASLTLDTACSSSLNATHLAVQGLKSGESSMAVVGGCNLFYNPDTLMPLTSLGFLSPDGKCHSFDHRANGYSRGEGFGVVILKRVSDALRDGNTIRAIIRGTSSNQDGKSPGLTQPTRQGQVELINQAYQTAGLDFTQTRFFEAHGTGTTLGDPIEAGAIADVFTTHRSEEEPIYVGAVKSAVGHLEGAAGVAGLIKTVLVLETGIIPPNQWFEKPNPKIPADQWHLAFPTQPTLWPQPGLRRASVNCFGYGGSNAHAILEDAFHYLKEHHLVGVHRTIEHPVLPNLSVPVAIEVNGQANGEEMSNGTSGTHDNGVNGHANGVNGQTNGINGHLIVVNGHTNGTHVNGNGITNGTTNGVNGHQATENNSERVYILSSYDEAGVKRLAETFADYLDQKASSVDDEERFLNDLSYTLATKRTVFPWRASVVAKDVDSLKSEFSSLSSSIRSGTDGRLALVFTGQGAQWSAMGRELFAFPVFKESLLAADKYMRSLGCTWSLVDELQKDESSTNINNAAFSQPICTALQVALVELLNSWAVKYGAVVGHSSGEIAAAFAAGAISRESAWKIAYYRGLLSGKLARAGGDAVGMVSVALPAEKAAAYIAKVDEYGTPGGLTIACINSPKNVTVSGSAEKLSALQALLESEGIFNRKLKVDNAYHSPYMQSIAKEYADLIGEITPGARFATIKKGVAAAAAPIFYSSLTGEKAALGELQAPAYWVGNLVSPVKFSQAITHMLTDRPGKAKKLGAPQATVNPVTELLEVGPHSALQGPLREIMEKISSAKDVGYNSLLKRNNGAAETALAAAGWLHNRGQPVDLQAVNSRPGTSPRMLIDLPPYVFNHTKSYWKESRLSKGYRFRQHPRLELLGAPVPDWNKNNAIWRNWIRVRENPWVKDHRITGSILYPGAGMMVMAIEACRQLANPKKVLKGFRLREVVFQVALRVPTSIDGIETHFYVRPFFDSTSSTSSNWNEFQLSSFDGEEWRDHCRGLIQPDYEVPVNPIDGGLEQEAFIEACEKTVSDAEAACQKTVFPKELYELLHTVGFDFGDTFQTLSDLTINTTEERSAVATVNEPDIKSKMAENYLQPYLIHPTTLDGVLQTIIVALTRGGRDIRDAMVPTSIKELWLAADAEASYESLRISAKADFLGLRQAEAFATALHPVTRKPLITIDGFVSTAISGNASNASESAHHHLCFNTDWKPDVTLLTQNTASQLFKEQIPARLTAFDPEEVILDVERMCYMYLRRAIKAVDPEKVDATRPWYQKYIGWMQHQFERHAAGDLSHAVKAGENWDLLAEDDIYFAKLEAKLEHATPEAKMSVIVGKQLKQILEGDKDPLEILFNDGVAENIYRFGTGAEIGCSYLTSYFDALAHKNSNLVMLEIGAGTGGATVPILDVLAHQSSTEYGAARFERYDFTDISPSFFEAAKETFARTIDRMRFQTLDVEKDHVEQGFESESYDVVVASNVIHATKNVAKTLTNVRKLMKPGAKLVLYELSNPYVVRTGFGFGLLPGWWLSEEPDRKWGPLLTVSEWHVQLQRAGFSGVDMHFYDYPDQDNQINTIIVATASGPETEYRTLPPALVVYDEKSKVQVDAAVQLQRELSARSPQVDTVPLTKMDQATFDQKLVVFLPEVEKPLLDNLDEPLFKGLQKVTESADSIVWLAQGGGPASQNPNGDMISGFSRVVRQENPAIKFLTLHIDAVRSSEAVASAAYKLIDEVLAKKDTTKTASATAPDNSFYEKNGVMYVNRLVEATYMNDFIALKSATPTPHDGPFGGDGTAESERALKLVIGSPGLLDTLQFVDDPGYNAPLVDGDVEFKVHAAGLNFLDIMIALGQVIGNDLGVEGAGIVTRTAPGSQFKVGDKVCGIAAGTLNTFARAKESSIIRMPDNLGFAGAAGFTVVFVTAWSALCDIANIQSGESVLIHAAAGGVGQACIQLAKVRGAEIYATVGSIEKRDLLMKTYGIPKDHIFSSRDLSFAQGIKRMTKGRGVDVAVNSLSGDALRATWDCIASFGRFVEVGKVDIYSSARLNMDKFKNNVSFEFVDISFIAKHNGKRFKGILESLMALVEAGRIGPLEPTQTFSFDKMQESFRYMQSGVHSGKIVLEPHAEDIVPIVPSRKSTYNFDPSVSFVLSGGLGGLGRSVARWMAARGARNLILLSRSGNTKDSSRELVSDLEKLGVRVATPKCDVTDPASLKAALDECTAAGFPPVKGCIQGSMVLKDTTFANMTLEDYYTALRPKLNASWNLHDLLPKDMDFFILLSSIACIVGNRGQLNYNTGNAFQDALARYRVLNGMKGTALDLGMILSVGYVAENDADLIDHLRDVGVEPMREEEFHAILEAICDPSNPTPTPQVASALSESLVKSQISLGLQMPETRVATGAEEPGWMREPLFRHLHQVRTLEGVAETDGKSVNYAVLLAGADTFEAAVDIVYEAMVAKLVKALNINAADVDPTKPLHALGVDSLVAVELRTWMLKQLDADVAVFDLMEVSSIRALASLIATRSSFVKNDEVEE